MIKGITYNILISLICFTSLYTMDEPFMCKVSREDSAMAEVNLKQGIYIYNPSKTTAIWEPALQQAVAQFRKATGLSNPSSMIRTEVEKAFPVCDIVEPVVVLEDKNSTTSVTAELQFIKLARPVKVLVIGSENKSPAMARFDIYHECGHLKHGDVILGADLLSISLNVGVSSLTGAALYKAMVQQPKMAKFGVPLLGMLTAFYLTPKIYRGLIRSAAIREQERKADLFALNHLIKQGDILSIATAFLRFTMVAEADGVFEPSYLWFLEDHPSNSERARCVLQELQKAGINLADLPLPSNEAQCDKKGLQELFDAQVEKHFPEFVV